MVTWQQLQGKKKDTELELLQSSLPREVSLIHLAGGSLKDPTSKTNFDVT